MPILKTFKTESGATMTWHRVSKVESSMLDSHAVAVCTVHCWPDLDAFIETNGGRFSWTEYVPIPQALVDGADFVGSLERALISVAESPFYGGSVAPMPSGLDMARQLRWAQMKQMRSLLMAQPIEFDGMVFDADPASLNNIVNSVRKMELAGEASMRWTLEDNTVATVTLEQLRGLGLKIGERIDQLYEVGRELYTSIFDPALSTVEEVAAIKWPLPAAPGVVAGGS